MLNQNNAQEFKLADYSARFWIEHTHATEELTEGHSQEAIILFSEKDAYLNWLRVHDPDDPRRKTNFQKSLQSLSHPLYYASLAGLRKIAKIHSRKAPASTRRVDTTAMRSRRLHL